MRSDQDNPAPKRNWWLLGPFLAIILGLNFWFDYYHPLGILLDIVILIVLIDRWTSRNKPN
jgi:hypothetical protein